jgi:hypothetical protein
MILTALVNAVLGVFCGLRFRVLILAPLAGLAVVEILLLKLSHEGWLSIFIAAVVLLFSLEGGYFIGAILGDSRLLSEFPLLRGWSKLLLMNFFFSQDRFGM